MTKSSFCTAVFRTYYGQPERYAKRRSHQRIMQVKQDPNLPKIVGSAGNPPSLTVTFPDGNVHSYGIYDQRELERLVERAKTDPHGVVNHLKDGVKNGDVYYRNLTNPQKQGTVFHEDAPPMLAGSPQENNSPEQAAPDWETDPSIPEPGMEEHFSAGAQPMDKYAVKKPRSIFDSLPDLSDPAKYAAKTGRKSASLQGQSSLFEKTAPSVVKVDKLPDMPEMSPTTTASTPPSTAQKSIVAGGESIAPPPTEAPKIVTKTIKARPLSDERRVKGLQDDLGNWFRIHNQDIHGLPPNSAVKLVKYLAHEGRLFRLSHVDHPEHGSFIHVEHGVPSDVPHQGRGTRVEMQAVSPETSQAMKYLPANHPLVELASEMMYGPKDITKTTKTGVRRAVSAGIDPELVRKRASFLANAVSPERGVGKGKLEGLKPSPPTATPPAEPREPVIGGRADETVYPQLPVASGPVATPPQQLDPRKRRFGAFSLSSSARRFADAVVEKYTQVCQEHDLLQRFAAAYYGEVERYGGQQAGHHIDFEGFNNGIPAATMMQPMKLQSAVGNGPPRHGRGAGAKAGTFAPNPLSGANKYAAKVKGLRPLKKPDVIKPTPGQTSMFEAPLSADLPTPTNDIPFGFSNPTQALPPGKDAHIKALEVIGLAPAKAKTKAVSTPASAASPLETMFASPPTNISTETDANLVAMSRRGQRLRRLQEQLKKLGDSPEAASVQNEIKQLSAERSRHRDAETELFARAQEGAKSLKRKLPVHLHAEVDNMLNALEDARGNPDMGVFQRALSDEVDEKTGKRRGYDPTILGEGGRPASFSTHIRNMLQRYLMSRPQRKQARESMVIGGKGHGEHVGDEEQQPREIADPKGPQSSDEWQDIEPSEQSKQHLQQLRQNSLARIDSTKGDHKYIVLASNLTPELAANLVPDTKKGQRVPGKVYQGIPIIGNFFRHKTLRGGDNDYQDVIVVNSPQEALQQYRAYKQGGAKQFTQIVDMRSGVHQHSTGGGVSARSTSDRPLASDEEILRAANPQGRAQKAAVLNLEAKLVKDRLKKMSPETQWLMQSHLSGMSPEYIAGVLSIPRGTDLEKEAPNNDALQHVMQTPSLRSVLDDDFRSRLSGMLRFNRSTGKEYPLHKSVAGYIRSTIDRLKQIPGAQAIREKRETGDAGTKFADEFMRVYFGESVPSPAPSQQTDQPAPAPQWPPKIPSKLASKGKRKVKSGTGQTTMQFQPESKNALTAPIEQLQTIPDSPTGHPAPPRQPPLEGNERWALDTGEAVDINELKKLHAVATKHGLIFKIKMPPRTTGKQQMGAIRWFTFTPAKWKERFAQRGRPEKYGLAIDVSPHRTYGGTEMPSGQKAPSVGSDVLGAIASGLVGGRRGGSQMAHAFSTPKQTRQPAGPKPPAPPRGLTAAEADQLGNEMVQSRVKADNAGRITRTKPGAAGMIDYPDLSTEANEGKKAAVKPPKAGKAAAQVKSPEDVAREEQTRRDNAIAKSLRAKQSRERAEKADRGEVTSGQRGNRREAASTDSPGKMPVAKPREIATEMRFQEEAAHNGFSVPTYKEIANEAWADERPRLEAMDKARKDILRRISSSRGAKFNLGTLRFFSSRGRDETSFPELPFIARQVASEYPDLGWGKGFIHGEVAGTEPDYGALAWKLLTDPKVRFMPDEDSDEYHYHVQRFLKDNPREPDAPEGGSPALSTGQSSAQPQPPTQSAAAAKPSPPKSQKTLELKEQESIGRLKQQFNATNDPKERQLLRQKIKSLRDASRPAIDPRLQEIENLSERVYGPLGVYHTHPRDIQAMQDRIADLKKELKEESPDYEPFSLDESSTSFTARNHDATRDLYTAVHAAYYHKTTFPPQRVARKNSAPKKSKVH